MTIDANLISTTREDDASYIALGDLAAVLSRHSGTKIIGGHMVSLIAAAFPSPGLIERRTGDADAGIPVQLADAGEVHVDLLNAGYEAESGNRYVKTRYDHPKPTIDLLIPAFSGRLATRFEVTGDSTPCPDSSSPLVEVWTSPRMSPIATARRGRSRRRCRRSIQLSS